MALGERLLVQMNRLEALAKRHPDRLALALYGFCFLALLSAGVYAIYYTRTNLQNAKASVDWPTTEGTIVVNKRAQSLPDSVPGRITYVYSVAGVSYSSDNVVFGHGYTYDHFSRYPVGTKVTVTYDPDDVTNAVLERTTSNDSTALYFGIGALLFCSCFFMVAAYQTTRTMFRRSKKQSDSDVNV